MPSKKDSATLSKTFLSSGEGAARSTRGIKSERIFIVPDIHCDDDDRHAVALAIQLCQAYKPDLVIFIGDEMDAGWASDKYNFPKQKRKGQFAREKHRWMDIHPHFKARRRILLPSNHTQRLLDRREEMEEFDGLEEFRIEKYLGLGNIEWIEAGFIELAEGAFIVTHGDRVRKGSGNSAAGEMQDVWCVSGASGHTHRLGTRYWNTYSGLRSWTECGNLCKNPPRYRKCNQPGPQDWHQGVVTLEVMGNQFEPKIIPFTRSYHAMLGGKRYSA
jgi:hypothetical protein